MRYANRKQRNGNSQLVTIQHGSSIQHIIELFNDTSLTNQIKSSPHIDENVWRFENSQGTESFSREWKSESSVVSHIYYALNMKEVWERSRRWRSLLHHKWIMLLLLLITLCLRQGKCQQCDFPSPLVFPVSETDPAETEIFKANSYNRTHSYRYTTRHAWLSSFLNFSLNDTDLAYYMRLSQPLDLEEIYYNRSVADISVFSFILYCQAQSEWNQEYHIMVGAVSEWSPEFNTSSIEISVKETLPVNAVVINLTNWAHDYDVNPVTKEIAMFRFLQYTGDDQVDGLTWLKMLISNDGIVVVKKELDYDALPENKKFLLLGLHVADQEGRTGTTSLTVSIQDDDTKPPGFTYPGCGTPCHVTYSVTVSPNITGHVTGIKPTPIEARDGDTLNYQIVYYIVQGPQNYEQFIIINNITGQLTILKELRDSGLSILVLIVEAREVSLLARSTRTTLLVTVAGGTKEDEVVAATGAGDDTNITVVATVLAVAVFLVVVLLIVVMVYFKMRYKKTVHPENSLTIFQVSGNEGIHVTHNKPLFSTDDSEKILSRRADSQATLGSDDQGDVYAAPPRPTPQHKTPHMLNTNGNMQHTSTNRREFSASQNSTKIFNGKEDIVEYLVPTSDINLVTSSSLTAKMNTHELQMNMHELQMNTHGPHTEQTEFPPRPSLKVVSGLKFPDKTDYFDTHYDTVDTMGEGFTTKREGADARKNSTTRDGGGLADARGNSTTRDGAGLADAHGNSTTRDGAGLADARENSTTRDGAGLADAHGNSTTRDGAGLADARGNSTTRDGGGLADARGNSTTRDGGGLADARGNSTTKDGGGLADARGNSTTRDGAGLADARGNSTTRDGARLADAHGNSTTKGGLYDAREDSKTRRELSDAREDSKTRGELFGAQENSTRKELYGTREDSKTRGEPYGARVNSTRNELSGSREDSTTKSELSIAERLSLSSSMIAIPVTENNMSYSKAPPRKENKKHQTREQTPRGSEEIIYDGTENIPNVEFDFDFYRDSSKTRIKRSSRLPVTIPDPNDTRYWITVSDDY